VGYFTVVGMSVIWPSASFFSTFSVAAN